MTIFKHKSWSIVAEQYSTSQSWGHKATLLLENCFCEEHKIRYHNRTWEAWTFQSVICGLIEKRIKRYEEECYEYYKRYNGKMRLSKEDKQNAWKKYKTRYVEELEEFYEQVKKNDYKNEYR